jgi:hypothetical protein
LGLTIMLSLTAGLAAPAQAASHHSRPLISWSQSVVPATVRSGHEAVVVAHFFTSRTIHNAVFSIRLSGGLTSRPSSMTWGTVAGSRWHDLAFVVAAPSYVQPGQYAGTVRLERWLRQSPEDDLDLVRLGQPLTLLVQVVATPLITWSPTNLGRVALNKGQTITLSASFVSNVAMTNVQLGRSLSSYALSQGLVVTPVGISPATTSIAPYTRYTATYTVAAAANTAAGLYGLNLYLTGSYNGGTALVLSHELHTTLDVRSISPLLTWTPGDLGHITLMPGQTVTETASFVSNVALTNVQFGRDLETAAANGGVSINFVGMNPAATTLAPGVPYAVTFTIAAAPTALIGSYNPGIYLTGSANGGPVVRLWHDVDFSLSIAVPSPVVTWPSGEPASYATILRSAGPVSVTETATISSNVSIANASLMTQLSGAAVAQGITITPVALPGGNVAPGTATPIGFILSVPPTAQPGIFSGYLWLAGQPTGYAGVQQLAHRLYFVFAVS